MLEVFWSVRGLLGKKQRLIYAWLGLLFTSLLAAAPLTASADQSPTGCNSNRLNTSIVKDHTEVYQGQTLTYSITVSNANFNTDIACDITNATVTVTLPAADGTPTGTVVTLASGVNYPAGTGVTLVGTVPYVVNVNPGVTDIVAQVSANGTLHDAPVDHSALIIKTVGTSIIAAPSTNTGSGGGTGSSGGGTTTSIYPKLPNTGLRN